MISTGATEGAVEREIFFFQAEDGIRDLVRSRGLGDVYKRQEGESESSQVRGIVQSSAHSLAHRRHGETGERLHDCLLYTSDAADERSSVDLGGRRIIKKKNKYGRRDSPQTNTKHRYPTQTTSRW